jgi:RHS repeat-associated protein
VGDWPPTYSCTNDPEVSTDRLSLFDGNGNLIRRAYIYFENGTWDTGIDVPCGQTLNYQSSIKYLTTGGLVQNTLVVTPLNSTCADRRECGGGGGTSVGLPINVGSGDVMVRQPLFSIAQEPMTLPFTLTYHSSTSMFPSLISEPVGKGWTHEYNQILKAESGTNGDRLYRLTAEGYEEEYLRIAPSTTWIAIDPGEARGTVTLVGSEYLLTDLNGTVTHFDTATGHWNSTVDRWGNTISATYTTGQLTKITDTAGRQITISYGSTVTITLPSTKTWKLTLSGGNLTAVRDPLHPSSDWRTYTYVNDHAGVQRLLSSIKDDNPKELEGHTYDNGAGGTDRGLTSSQAGGTKSNVSISYNDAGGQRTVTHTIDGSTNQSTIFNVSYLVGRWLPTQISGNCATCGGADADLEIFTYDYSNHVIDRKDGDPAQSQQVEAQYDYDGNGMMTQKIEAFGKPEQRTTSYEYAYTPPVGTPVWPAFMTKLTEQSVGNPGPSNNKVTTFTWNSSGTPETTLTTQVVGWVPQPTGGPQQVTYTTTSTFDSPATAPKHRLTNVAGPATNQQIAYGFTANAATNDGGRRNLTQLYTGATTHLDTSFANYDLYGTALTVTDPNGAQTITGTDDRGRVLSVQSKAPAADTNEPGPYTTTYTYDSRDRLSSVALPLANKTSYAYEDGTNRLTDTIRVDSSAKQQERIHLTLNTIGDKIQEDYQKCTTPASSCASWAAAARTDAFTYDTHNRLQKITHTDTGNTHIDYTYDTRGNLKTVKDENHSAANTTYTYDGLNRLTQVDQTLPATTTYGYDAHDNLTSVIDPNTNQTSYNYDDFRRMQKQVSPVTGTTTYVYDAAGNLLTVTDANSATTTRTYDAANRVTSSVSTRSNRATETVSWTYDNTALGGYGGGRVGRVTEPTGTTQYSYDRRGLVKAERKAVWDNTFSTLYGYDANGNRTTITYPSQKAVTYTYDFADRPLSAVAGAVTYVSATSGATTYAPFGPSTQFKFGNGTTRTMQYDLRYRMTLNKLVKDSGSVTLADYHTIGYDGVGNVTSIPDAQDSTYSRTSMTYDDLNRLKTAATGSSLWSTGTYNYDSMGNVTSLSLSSGATVRSATFSYSGTTPKLASVTEQSPIGTRTVAYDSAGNETQVGPTANSFLYSARNFLAVSSVDPAAGFAYDYDGRGVRMVARENVLSITGLSPGSKAAGGASFTLYVFGTKFSGSSVVKWNGSARTTTFDSANQIHATINASDIATAGTLAPITVTDGAATSNSTNFVVDFSDEPNTDPFYPYVTIVAARGITAGCGGTQFCPSTSIRRDQMSVFLLKAKDGSGYTPPACHSIFSDVTCPSTFANWVEDAYNRGIMDACVASPLQFCPSTSVTRETMADFLLHGLEGATYTPVPAVGVFSDVPTSNPHAKFIEEIARRGITGGCGTGIYCPTNPVTRAQMATFLSKTWGFTTSVTPGGNKRYFVYSPELSLITETDWNTIYHPVISYEHIWMAGAPVAEVDTVSSTTHWTLTDHLGTPIMQTDSSATPYWRVEQEPYGRIWAKRPTSLADQHQILRLPGQETEQQPTNSVNGLSERSYNIFRWYRPTWGRYAEADPLRYAAISQYSYVDDDPLSWVDALGLYKHKPGGPYHPFGKTRCQMPDSCSLLYQKLDEIERTIASHRQFIRDHPGDTTHQGELDDWYRARNNCSAIIRLKCSPGSKCTLCEKVKEPSAVVIGGYIAYKIIEACTVPYLVPVTP